MKPVEDPAALQAKLLEGFSLQQNGALDEAAGIYREVLACAPRHFDALHLLGVIAAQNQDFAEAVRLIGTALEINSNHAGAHYNLGYALEDLRRYGDAIASYDRAIALKADYALAYNNRGIALHALRLFQAAVASFEKAIAFEPGYAEAHYNRGVSLSEIGQHAAALESLDRAVQLKPDYEFLRGVRLYTQMRICDWWGLDQGIAALSGELAQGKPTTSPFPVLSLIDSPSLQRKAAEIWARTKHPKVALPLVPAALGHRKIRVGYFSMDFREHPVAILSAGLFESHDRTKFETFAFSFGADTGDAMQMRLRHAFDRFLDVREKTDREIAALARSLGLDIAVDLAGYTTESRTGIFADRAAPVQISYLGYAGTMSADFIDYIVADHVLIPAENRQHYREKIIYLPCFQVNDRTRAIAAKNLARAELGLPESGFVFCCFNNANKISPASFAGWMRILKAVPGSMLWLANHNGDARRNLREAASRAGVEPTRLVFAAHVAAAEHLARHRAADLFLDTLPFNAHTTASDALWAGLPVLTCGGEGYAARVGASLLSALGLPELVAANQADFEARAIALASDPGRLADLRRKLGEHRLTSVLFDTAGFTRNLELAYRRAVERSLTGPPDDIFIAAP